MNEKSKFDKFTERAKKVLSLAPEEALRFKHPSSDTEHLLVGLLREGEGVAASVLNRLGVELHKVRDAVEARVGSGDHIVLGEIGLTPPAKQVIELTVDAARRLNQQSSGTAHLLLGLVREGEGIAAGVLESLDVRLERVRTETMEALKQQQHRQRFSFPHPCSAVRYPGKCLVMSRIWSDTSVHNNRHGSGFSAVYEHVALAPSQRPGKEQERTRASLLFFSSFTPR